MTIVREFRTFTHMLPAQPDRCPLCAHHHAPAEPHNRYSMFYQMKFYQEHGRWPTWADAMAHCSEEVKQRWIEAIIGNGQGLGEVELP